MRIPPRLFALLPAAVAINLVVGSVVKELSLPVYLDTLGTVLVAVLAGAWPGVIVGTLSQLLLGLLTGYQYLPFVVIQWTLALLIAFAARHRALATVWTALLAAVAIGLVCGLVSALVSYTLFRGATGGGVSWITALLRSAGVPLGRAVVLSSGGTDVLDKSIVIVVATGLIRSFPRRLLARFPLAAHATAR